MIDTRNQTPANDYTTQPSRRSKEFQTAFKCVWIFGVASAISLASVVATAILGGAPSTFMWVRAAVLLAVTPLLLRLTRRAGQGDDGMLRRLRIVSTILPIAVVVIDFIPGVAPIWYGAIQGVAALSLVPVAIVCWRWTRRSTEH